MEIRYADIINTYIDFDRISVAEGSTIYTVFESQFTVTRSPEGSQPKNANLFKLTRPLSHRSTWYSYNRRVALVRIMNSKFADETYQTPHNSTEYGVFITDASTVFLNNVEFDNFYRGFLFMNNDQVSIRSSLFTNCVLAAHGSGGGLFVCSSSFENNEFSVKVYDSGQSIYKDNTFTTMKGGVLSLNSGVNYLRNNDFAAYCYGLQSWQSTLFLRNQPRAGDDFGYGRNDFLGDADFNGTWGCYTTDIGLARQAALHVWCGYNMFSGYSTYHVSGDGTCTVDNASYNQWNPAPDYLIRYVNIAIAGDNRNIQEDPDPSCGFVINNNSCGPVVCPSGGAEAYLELGFSDTSLYVALTGVRSDVMNSGLAWKCRKDRAWEYFELVKRIDSSTFRDQLKSDMLTIYSNGGLDSNLRSTALFIKGKIHIAQEQFDSAKAVFDTLRSQFPNNTDSVTSHWQTLYINSVSDTLNKKDSLADVFTDRVLQDLRRKTTYGSTGLSKVNAVQFDKRESYALQDCELEFSEPIYPNPTGSSNIRIPIRSNLAAFGTARISTVQGEFVSDFEFQLIAGENTVGIPTHRLQPGAYVVQFNCGSSTAGFKFVLTP